MIATIVDQPGPLNYQKITAMCQPFAQIKINRKLLEDSLDFFIEERVDLIINQLRKKLSGLSVRVIDYKDRDFLAE